jgi:prephenate dehydrogenase
MAPQSFGIVGYGHFGGFLARSLKDHGNVVVTDIDSSKLPKSTNGVRAAPVETVAQADVVVLAVPFSALEPAIAEIRPFLPPDTVVMDVVSTKERATAALATVLGDHPNVMASHPLFGPPSMTRIEAGQHMVVTYEKGERTNEFRRFLKGDLHLKLLTISPEEHDRAMAYMQALPFFIARALGEMGVLDKLPHKDFLMLPSFEKLASIAAIEEHHSSDMFDTSQRSNPYAGEAREIFLEVVQALHRKLTEEPVDSN